MKRDRGFLIPSISNFFFFLQILQGNIEWIRTRTGVHVPSSFYGVYRFAGDLGEREPSQCLPCLHFIYKPDPLYRCRTGPDFESDTKELFTPVVN